MGTTYSMEIIKDISKKMLKKIDIASNTSYAKSAQFSSPTSPVQKDNLSTSETKAVDTNASPIGMSEQAKSTSNQNSTNNSGLTSTTNPTCATNSTNSQNITNNSNSTDDALSMAINFNSNSLVQGFIMSEILGSPKAKKWRGNTLWNSRF